jgi:hypothetical protein
MGREGNCVDPQTTTQKDVAIMFMSHENVQVQEYQLYERTKASIYRTRTVNTSLIRGENCTIFSQIQLSSATTANY